MSDVLELGRQADHRVVAWHDLGCVGLLARQAGVSRVCIARHSPGCGVRRRQKGRSLFYGQDLDCAFGSVPVLAQGMRVSEGGQRSSVCVTDRGYRW